MKILVTGANGFIATYLLDLLSQFPGYTIIACGRTIPVKALSHVNVQYQEIDLACRREAIAFYRATAPDIIIHTAAISNVEECETNPEKCQEVNVEVTATICEAAKTMSSYLLFLSTDHVFDGRIGHYNELAATDPLNKYGASKLAGEQLILSSGVAYGIARTSLVYGRSNGKSKNFVEFVRERLESGLAVHLAVDQLRSPTLVTDLCRGLARMLSERTPGIFHLAGKESVSIYETGLLIAEVLGLEKKWIVPVETKDLRHVAPRPLNTSLDCRKARIVLNYQVCSIKNGLKQVLTD
jgi:dTDP-4-dehydrorhamnose reductase